MAGVLLPRRDISKKEQDTINKINERSTGIKREHLTQCAARARQTHMPGTVVIALGKNKANFVLESVKLGLVNHLIIDDDLENKLLSLLSLQEGI
jgi:DNA-binding transcriptional regulator LsrR (DeoR family)